MAAREVPVRRVAVVVGAWVLVAVAGSWLVWAVVSAVGQEQLAGGAGSARPSAVGTAASPTPPAPGPSGADATGAPEPAPTPSPSRTPRGDAAPTTPPRTTTPTRTGAPSAGSPATRTRAWSGPAGVVTTRCTGSRIELAGASASADGYVVEVEDRGPERVRVEFEGRNDETVPETRVEARCVGGRPAYSVRSRD